MRLSFGDAGLGALDALGGVDSLCLFVVEDERPLRGLAGYADWRLCGGVSRILASNRFTGALGDALLFPANGRLPCERVFAFGAGMHAALTPGAAASVLRRAAEALTRAGARGVALEVPFAQFAALHDLAQLFLAEFAARFGGERIVLLGDGRGLARAFHEVGGRLQGLAMDKEPLGSAAAAAAVPAARPAAPRVQPRQ